MSSQPTRPEIDFPGEVPSDLVIEDITVGDGAEATVTTDQTDATVGIEPVTADGSAVDEDGDDTAVPVVPMVIALVVVAAVIGAVVVRGRRPTAED